MTLKKIDLAFVAITQKRLQALRSVLASRLPPHGKPLTARSVSMKHTSKPSPEKPSAPGPFDFRILRELRQRDQLTIREVAERSGVSAAVISRLERNQCEATLDALSHLARVFSLSTTDLIALAETPLAARFAERRHQGDGFQLRRVRAGDLTCFLAEAMDGARYAHPGGPPGESILCWVLEGAIRLTLPTQATLLRPGQAVRFDAAQGYALEALEEARLYLAATHAPRRS